MNQPNPIRLNNETPEEKARYYNKEAANFRQEMINHQVKFFLESGGKITKLPAYDDLSVEWQTETSIYGRKYK